MHLQFVEAKGEDGTRGLRRVALMPVVAVEFVADVCLAPFGVVNANAAVANQLPIRLERDRQLELRARRFALRCDKHLHERFHVGFAALAPVVITEVERIGLIGEHCAPIILAKFAQHEARGF